MLANAIVCATVPTTDLERSARFYEQTLGLTGTRLGLDGGVYYEGGGGTMLHMYETTVPATGHTVAVFLVEDLDGVIAGLEARGVTFGYDVPEAEGAEGGFRGARFEDPDGNVVAVRSY